MSSAVFFFVFLSKKNTIILIYVILKITPFSGEHDRETTITGVKGQKYVLCYDRAACGHDNVY